MWSDDRSSRIRGATLWSSGLCFWRRLFSGLSVRGERFSRLRIFVAEAGSAGEAGSCLLGWVASAPLAARGATRRSSGRPSVLSRRGSHALLMQWREERSSAPSAARSSTWICRANIVEATRSAPSWWCPSGRRFVAAVTHTLLCWWVCAFPPSRPKLLWPRGRNDFGRAAFLSVRRERSRCGQPPALVPPQVERSLRRQLPVLRRRPMHRMLRRPRGALH